MFRLITSVFLLYLCLSCSLPPEAPYLIYDCEEGICAELMWSDSTYVTDYDSDNVIFRLGREFVYDYYYITPEGDTTLIGLEGHAIDGPGIINSATITEVSFHADSSMGAQMREMIPGYSQTGLKYDYYDRDKKSLYPKEGSGVIENERNVWVHPFRRDLYFAMLNANPYPFVRLPIQKGDRYNWELTIGGSKYLHPIWTDLTESTLRQHTYEVIGQRKYETPFAGRLEVWEIKATTTGEAGPSALTFFFHEDYGFVYLNYDNLPGSKFVFTLREIRER
ncbi:hypothetical protein [Neolewinella persica]|uniref:hypothetical protein n=1 Tax=Neolewinella persica TaxID=70998 RepID=UPI000475FD94|nr:hypothetical protein [Neolewinella persica]